MAGAADLFAREDSIVRRIWGDVDVIMLVFAGSAAEFGLNKAVDWLFVTGDLPRDPIGRFFSTAAYARRIVFATRQEADAAFASINSAHAWVEKKRGGQIPEWAHRDVLYMLIDHSERAFQALHRPLTATERDDMYDVFRRVGEGLGVKQLPMTYTAWTEDRERHLQADLAVSPNTIALDESYRRAVGAWRMILVRQLQALLSPPRVRELLGLTRRPWIRFLIPFYPVVAALHLRSLAHRLLVPPAYLGQLRALEMQSGAGR